MNNLKTELLEEYRNFFEQGHGGGNWRRLVIQSEDLISQAIDKSYEAGIKEAIDVVNKEYDDTWNGAQGNYSEELADFNKNIIKKLEEMKDEQ